MVVVVSELERRRRRRLVEGEEDGDVDVDPGVRRSVVRRREGVRPVDAEEAASTSWSWTAAPGSEKRTRFFAPRLGVAGRAVGALAAREEEERVRRLLEEWASVSWCDDGGGATEARRPRRRASGRWSSVIFVDFMIRNSNKLFSRRWASGADGVLWVKWSGQDSQTARGPRGSKEGRCGHGPFSGD